jgi:hypothetical protein
LDYKEKARRVLSRISNDQRRPIANANFVATVHHGIPTH